MKKAIVFHTLLLSFVISLFTSSVFAEEASFTDVEGHWAKDTIKWAVENEIVSGYPDGTFKPDKIVTGAEFFSMLFNSFSSTKDADEKWKQSPNYDPAKWQTPYYIVAKKMGLVSQSFDNYFPPDKPITRGWVARIIVTALGERHYMEGAITYLYDHGLSNGKKSKTIQGFDIMAPLTRAEAVQFMKALHDKNLTGEIKKAPAMTPEVLFGTNISKYNPKPKVIGEMHPPTWTEFMDFLFKTDAFRPYQGNELSMTDGGAFMLYRIKPDERYVLSGHASPKKGTLALHIESSAPDVPQLVEQMLKMYNLPTGTVVADISKCIGLNGPGTAPNHMETKYGNYKVVIDGPFATTTFTMTKIK